MANNVKATMAKRARELGQKDRVRERDERRAERKARAEARAASGQIGPEIGEPQPSLTEDLPPNTLPDPTPGSSSDRS